MAIGVIHFLEEVDIHEEETENSIFHHGSPLVLGIQQVMLVLDKSGDVGLQNLMNEAPVPESGQAVRQGGLAQLFGGLTQLLGTFGDDIFEVILLASQLQGIQIDDPDKRHTLRENPQDISPDRAKPWREDA